MRRALTGVLRGSPIAREIIRKLLCCLTSRSLITQAARRSLPRFTGAAESIRMPSKALRRLRPTTRKLSTTYLHYYYAQLATERLKEMHGVTAIDMPQLVGIHREEIPALTDDGP